MRAHPIAGAVLLTASLLPAAPAYEADVQTWRQKREASLRSEHGWLAVAGLFWLEPGPNIMGSAPTSRVVLPAGPWPGRAGVLELTGRKVMLTLNAGVKALVNGAPVTGPVELKADTSDKPAVLTIEHVKMQVLERGGKLAVRMWDPQNANRRDFKGLHWYPIKESWQVAARWEPYSPPKKIAIANVIGQEEQMICPGRAVFQIGGQEVALEPVLEDPNATQLFFIFRDETSGKDTYGAGRFLYAAMPKQGQMVLDFNKAYTPPCGFTAHATCPLPPRQNRIAVRIEAGERRPDPIKGVDH